jgi:hypothetical protein
MAGHFDIDPARVTDEARFRDDLGAEAARHCIGHASTAFLKWPEAPPAELAGRSHPDC